MTQEQSGFYEAILKFARESLVNELVKDFDAKINELEGRKAEIVLRALESMPIHINAKPEGLTIVLSIEKTK